jgi:hypothetical protein
MSAVAEISLWEAFESVPDPRKKRGVRHPIRALLTLAATAIISGAKSVNAIADFGRDHPRLTKPLGFTRKDLPCQATFHNLFKALDADQFEAAIRTWAQLFCAPDGVRKVVHIDGKSLRGSARGASACAHLLSAYCADAGAIMAQLKVDGKTNEPKAALELLRLIPMKGTIVTGDAIFAQRDLSKQIMEEGGDYVWTVKDNQKTLKTEIENAFPKDVFPPRPTSAQS